MAHCALETVLYVSIRELTRLRYPRRDISKVLILWKRSTLRNNPPIIRRLKAAFHPLFSLSRFTWVEPQLADISSGSSVNLISDTTSNRSFLRRYPHFLANIYIHLTRRRINGVRSDRAPIDRSVLIFRLSHGRQDTPRGIDFASRFPVSSMRERPHCFWREQLERARFSRRDPRSKMALVRVNLRARPAIKLDCLYIPG